VADPIEERFDHFRDLWAPVEGPLSSQALDEWVREWSSGKDPLVGSILSSFATKRAGKLMEEADKAADEEQGVPPAIKQVWKAISLDLALRMAIDWLVEEAGILVSEPISFKPKEWAQYGIQTTHYPGCMRCYHPFRRWLDEFSV
jgi:hypothetical protein